MSAPPRAALAVALLALGGPALADPPRRQLPAEPWPVVDVIALDGSRGSPPLALPDGRIAVLTRAPPTLSLVDPRSGNVRASPLQEAPSEDLRPRLDTRGRLVFQGEGRTLFRLGLDGQIRAAAVMPGSLHGFFENDDGTAVGVAGPDEQTDFVSLRNDGSVASVRSLVRSSRSAGPARLEDGRVAVAIPWGIAAFDRSGAIQVVPGIDEVGQFLNVGRGAIAVAGGRLFPLDRGGVVGAPTPLGGVVAWWEPLTDGTALGWMEGAAPRMLFVARDGSVLRRVDAPPASAARGAAVDDAGTVLLVSALGLLTAVEPDGRTRWTLNLRRRVVPVVTLVGGDAWITAVDGPLIHLSPRSPCPPGDPACGPTNSTSSSPRS